MGQVLLHLVRHGRPQIQPGRAASTWSLDASANTDEMHRLRSLLEICGLLICAFWTSARRPSVTNGAGSDAVRRRLDGFASAPDRRSLPPADISSAAERPGSDLLGSQPAGWVTRA